MISTYYKSVKRRAGFTLIELMVSIGVTALLVSLMLTITINVLGGWNRSSGSLTAGNQARTVLDMLSRDLQAAVIKKDSNVWFAASIQQNQTSGGDSGMNGDAVWSSLKPSAALSTDPTVTSSSFVVPALTGSNTVPNLEDYRFGQGGVWLRFFTSATDSNTSTTTLSSPRAISYQILRLPVVVGSTEYRYQLFRSEVSSSNTFTAGYDMFGSVYNTASTSPSTLTSAGIIRRPEITSSSDRSLVLGNNIIDFGVRVYTRSSVNNLVLSFPISSSVLGYAATIQTTSPVPTPAPTSGAVSYVYPATAIPSSSPAATYGYPEVVEVFVRVLTDEGVLQIDNLENSRITGNWWDIALQNSKVYTRRIELKATGL